MFFVDHVPFRVQDEQKMQAFRFHNKKQLNNLIFVSASDAMNIFFFFLQLCTM